MSRLITHLRGARTRLKVLGLSAILVLAAAAVALAAPSGVLTPGTGGPQGLKAVGPVNSNNGFPDWYRDSKDVNLMPCYDPQDPYCGGAVGAPDNTAPIDFPGNFPDEFFYSNATADGLTSAGGNNVLAEFALEGAFANGGPTAGDQMVFSRIRYKITGGLKPDTDYKITQPYGTDTVTSDGNGAFFVTQDVGVTAGDFTQVMKGRVGPFLKWAPNPSNPADAPPTGYLGDGVTPHTVTGSELGTNFVRIQGTNIGGNAGDTNPNPCPTTGANAYTGPINDCVQTTNFVVVGKKAINSGVDATRVTYEKTATGSTKIDVLANSSEQQDIVVQDGDNGPGPARLFPTTPLRNTAGRYMAYVDVPGALPKFVDLVNRGDVPQTVKHVQLTDEVEASAIYHVTKAGGDSLHVSASSSDQSLTGADLTLPQFGDQPMGANLQTDVPMDAPPSTVTVKSSKGGQITVPVEVDGEGLNPLPLVAAAGPDLTVSQGASVTLDGSGSSGNIDSYAWTTTSGVTLTNAGSAKASFTAPSTAGDLTFTLTVTGPGGATATDEVIVGVKQDNPAKAVIAPVAPTVLQNLPITLDGSQSDGVSYEWSQVSGTPAANLGAANAKTETFTFPKTQTPIVIELRVRTAADTQPVGGPCVAPTCASTRITLTPAIDNLQRSPIVAKYDAGKQRWTVSGTATILVSNNVTVHSGPLSGPVIDKALVDPTGAWKVDVRGSKVAPANPRVVSVESDRGGVVTNIPVQ